MKFRPPWKEARVAGQAARNNHAAANASQDDDSISKRILVRQLTGMFKRYKFDEQKCFFCGDRGHHTGYLPGFDSVWICKAPQCQAQYNSAREDL